MNQHQVRVTSLKKLYYGKAKVYWSTNEQVLGKQCTGNSIKVAYVNGWYGFMFPFKDEWVQVFKAVKKSDRYFFKRSINAYQVFSGCLVREEAAQPLLAQLRDKIEFLVADRDGEANIPPIWSDLEFHLVI
jgi:hypothetical protein